MRAVGLSLGLLASMTLALVTTPALADDAKSPPTTPAPAAAPSSAAPAAAPASAPAPAAAPAPAPATASEADAKKDTSAPAEAPSTGSVTVHIEAPQQVSLERRKDGNSGWEHVCTSPCDQKLSVTDDYRIVGVDLNASRPFVLDATKGDSVVLNVWPGYHKKQVTGTWIAAGGGAVALTGIVIIAAGSTTAIAGVNGSGVTDHSNVDWVTAGTLLIMSGAAAAIYGGAMAIDNQYTGVNGATPTAAEKKPDAATVKVQARLPTFREAERGVTPAGFAFPVLHGVF